MTKLRAEDIQRDCLSLHRLLASHEASFLLQRGSGLLLSSGPLNSNARVRSLPVAVAAVEAFLAANRNMVEQGAALGRRVGNGYGEVLSSHDCISSGNCGAGRGRAKR